MLAALAATLVCAAPGANAAPRQTADRPDDRAGVHQVHAMYVLPSDGGDRGYDTDGTLATSVGAWHSWLRGQTGGKGLTLDTAGGELDVTFVRLASTDAQLASHGVYLRDELERQLAPRGFDRANKIYAVYYDGSLTGYCGGGAYPPTLPGRVAAMYLRASAGGQGCDSMGFASPGHPPGYLEFAMLHEIMHTMGLVAACAPNHTRTGHASDSPNDLMYAGDEHWYPSRLDIGRDDYYGHGRSDCLDLARSRFLEGNDRPKPDRYAKCRKLATTRRVANCIRRTKAIAKCKKLKPGAKRTRCLKRARAIRI